jgi:hypothetical protein
MQPIHVYLICQNGYGFACTKGSSRGEHRRGSRVSVVVVILVFWFKSPADVTVRMMRTATLLRTVAFSERGCSIVKTAHAPKVEVWCLFVRSLSTSNTCRIKAHYKCYVVLAELDKKRTGLLVYCSTLPLVETAEGILCE